MRYLKIIAVALLLAYIGRVVGFETWLGRTQPESNQTMKITTFDDEGEGHDRIVTQIWVDDELYVGVNHWPRLWYWRLLDNPEVEVTIDGETRRYRAVTLEGESYERVDEARPLSLSFRFKSGFPPRRIIHLQPLAQHAGDSSPAGQAAAAEPPVLKAISGQGGDPGGVEIRYYDGSPKTAGYLAVPDGEGPFPAVILIHEWDGLVERIRQTADGFAALGYIALAADLYQGRTGAKPEENMALVRETRANPETIIDNLNAAVAYVRDQTSAAGPVATIGWCFGGGVALSYALGGDRHEGTAIFYGQLIDDPERLASIDHEIHGTFAEHDESIPPADVDAFVAALREAGVSNDVHIYDGVDHGFWLHVDEDPETRLAPAQHALERLRAYLDRVL